LNLRVAVSSWPEDWEARYAGEICVICDALGHGDSDHWVHAADGECTETYLDRSSRIRGYCLAVWSRGHVAEPTELAAAAATAYWQEVLELGRAVVNAFDPVKINYFTLGNTVPHLHTHIVPRYIDDPAPGGPLSWDQVVGSSTFSEEQLREQASAIRVRFEGMS
jgi:diadenosine tetraphosphate (Ap4A) HIT family hydrolase